jgi:hypothetical protein
MRCFNFVHPGFQHVPECLDQHFAHFQVLGWNLMLRTHMTQHKNGGLLMEVELESIGNCLFFFIGAALQHHCIAIQ